VRQRGGETVYCRKETVIGTKISEEMCFTDEQLHEIERQKDSMTDDMNRRAPICGSGCSP